MKQVGKRIAEATKKDLTGLSLSRWDIKNIAYLIAFYEQTFPGDIAKIAREARRDIIKDRKLHAADTSKFTLKRRLAIPEDLLWELKRGYPAIISDKGQFEDFLRNFPIFDLGK